MSTEGGWRAPVFLLSFLTLCFPVLEVFLIVFDLFCKETMPHGDLAL